jgi:integrase
MPKYKHGSGSLFLRGRTWWLSYYIDSNRVRESSDSSDKAVARKLLQQRLGQVAEGRFIGPRADRVRIEELAELVLLDYRVNGKKSIGVTETRLRKHILPFFVNRRAHSITAEDLQAYIVRRQDARASNAEINRELAALKRAFNLGIRQEKIYRKPYIPKLTERNARAGFFEVRDFERILAKLPGHLRPAVTFAYYTGWRLRSEILPLRWEQIDLAAETVRLYPDTTKNSEPQVIQLPQVLLSILTEQWRAKLEGCPWIFPYQGKRVSYPYHAWRKAVEEAGLEGKIPHDFRRTAVRNLVRAGVPERVAMAICGHKTRAVFDRYNIVSPGDLAEAARKIDQSIASTPGEPEQQALPQDQDSQTALSLQRFHS